MSDTTGPDTGKPDQAAAAGSLDPADLLAALASRIADGGLRIVDLSLTLEPGLPTIVMPPELGQSAPFRIERISRYDADGPAWYWNNISMGEHTGTHFDAPVHWFTGRDRPLNTVDTLPPAHMLAPANVIDCSEDAARDADFLLTIGHVRAWEDRHGPIAPESWLLMRTGWSARTPRDYANLGDDGAHTPGPDADVIRWLVEERRILGFGTETIGTDAGQAARFNPPYPAHHYLHRAGRYGLQCLANLNHLPPKGAIIVTNPLKILNGSASPIRAIAIVP